MHPWLLACVVIWPIWFHDRKSVKWSSYSVPQGNVLCSRHTLPMMTIYGSSNIQMHAPALPMCHRPQRLFPLSSNDTLALPPDIFSSCVNLKRPTLVIRSHIVSPWVLKCLQALTVCHGCMVRQLKDQQISANYAMSCLIKFWFWILCLYDIDIR